MYFDELNNPSEFLLIEELYEKFVRFPFVSTDTRNIIPNSLFFCLKGDKFDGNQFVNEALEKGTKYVITEKRRKEKKKKRKKGESEENLTLLRSYGHTVLQVDDVLKTLQQLAQYHRNQLKIPVIGITGTNGKTTTKELVAAVLSKQYKTAYTKGNLNNHIGVPLTLLSIKKDDEIAVIEMGANHPGEIEQLCQIAQPDYGLITNIGKAHLEGFGTLENIIETKTALYRAAQTLFVNEEDEILKQKAGSKKQTIFYGKSTNISGNIVEMNPCLVINLLEKKIQTQLSGNYNLPNILAAAAIGKYFGVSEQDICDAISKYTPQNNRSQIIKNGTHTIIADYYNANPTSMKAALENFLQINAPNKLAILGDMLELGENSETEHQGIINFCEENNIETVFIGTEFFRWKNNRSKFFINVRDCNNYLNICKIDDTLILLKGSRGVHLEEIEL